MVTELWAVNPGVAVAMSAIGAFIVGCGVHIITRSTSINTGIEHALEETACKHNEAIKKGH